MKNEEIIDGVAKTSRKVLEMHEDLLILLQQQQDILKLLIRDSPNLSPEQRAAWLSALAHVETAVEREDAAVAEYRAGLEKFLKYQ